MGHVPLDPPDRGALSCERFGVFFTDVRAAFAAGGGARVVSVSSAAHLFSDIVFEDIHYADRPFDPWTAYGQSKTANILFAVEATRRWKDYGITVNALMPGSIRTALQRHVTEETLDRLRKATGSSTRNFKTTQQGAATSVLLATSPPLDGVGGRYFDDCNEVGPNTPGTRTGTRPRSACLIGHSHGGMEVAVPNWRA